MIPVIICVVIIVFSLMYMTPGDPVDTILAGADPTPEARNWASTEAIFSGLPAISRDFCTAILVWTTTQECLL